MCTPSLPLLDSCAFPGSLCSSVAAPNGPWSSLSSALLLLWTVMFVRCCHQYLSRISDEDDYNDNSAPSRRNAPLVGNGIRDQCSFSFRKGNMCLISPSDCEDHLGRGNKNQLQPSKAPENTITIPLWRWKRWLRESPPRLDRRRWISLIHLS